MKKRIKTKILVINDEETLARAVQSILREIGHKWVYTATTGDSGLRELREDHQIKLVLLDNMLPDMNGREFVDRWIEQGGYKGTAFVVMASFVTDDDKVFFESIVRQHPGLEYGGLVEVPFLPVHLFTAVERALRRIE